MGRQILKSGFIFTYDSHHYQRLKALWNIADSLQNVCVDCVMPEPRERTLPSQIRNDVKRLISCCKEQPKSRVDEPTPRSAEPHALPKDRKPRKKTPKQLRDQLQRRVKALHVYGQSLQVTANLANDDAEVQRLMKPLGIVTVVEKYVKSCLNSQRAKSKLKK